MVKLNPDTLDRTFAALADPTRRAMLARLAQGEDLAVGDLAKPFAMSLPAVLKHVNVLADARLIVREKRGRTVHCRLNGEPMQDAIGWLTHYERFWSERLDALAQYVEDDACPTQPSSNQSQASPSSDTSEPPSDGSSKPGRKGKR